MKKITLKSVTDDLAGAGLASIGAIGGYFAMDQVNANFGTKADGTENKLVKWLTPAVGFGIGFGARMLTDNQNVKDISTGVIVAGWLDLIKKSLQELNITAVKVPSINGMGNAPRLMEYNAPTTVFRGLGMDSGLLKEPGLLNSRLLA